MKGVYNLETCKRELRTIRRRFSKKMKWFLENERYRDAAGLIFAIKHDWMPNLFRTADELRLKGELNYEIYDKFMNGLDRIIEALWKIVKKKGVEKEVGNEYSFLRFEKYAREK